LRAAAKENIAEYCKTTGENETEIFKYFSKEADKYNLLLPVDFYLKIYNSSVELIKSI